MNGLFLPLGGWGEWSNVYFPYVVNYFDADFQDLLLSENWSGPAAQTDQSIQNPFGVVCTMGFIYNRMKECVRGGLIWEKPEVLPIRSPANPMEHPWSHLVYLSCVEGHVLELRATKYDEIWLCESSLSYWVIEPNINIWVWYICLLLQHYHFAFTLVNGMGYLLAHKLICKSDFNSMNFEEFMKFERHNKQRCGSQSSIFKKVAFWHFKACCQKPEIPPQSFSSWIEQKWIKKQANQTVKSSPSSKLMIHGSVPKSIALFGHYRTLSKK